MEVGIHVERVLHSVCLAPGTVEPEPAAVAEDEEK